jgi:hypothetical protein
MKQEWQKSLAETRQKPGLLWRNKKKLAKLSKTAFTYRSSS